MYYIACRLEWKPKNEFFMRDLDWMESQWIYDWRNQAEPNETERQEHDDCFETIRRDIENCFYGDFYLEEGHNRLDEALVEYITFLKGFFPEEAFMSPNVFSGFRRLYLSELRDTAKALERFGHSLSFDEDDFDFFYYVHLFWREDNESPYAKLGSFSDWGNITDIMVAACDTITKDQFHTVRCQNLDKLTDAEREDVYLYCGVKFQEGPQEYQVTPGFAHNDLERVPLIYELAHDIAEADEYGFKRPQEFVALENLIKAYMKDYGLSMVDDDLYYTEWDNEEGDYYLHLRIKVFFWLKGEGNQEWLEKCDEEGYYRTERREYRIIPYNDGYAVEYGPRQDV